MGKYASRRNFGYGKQIAHAGKVALRDHYGHGHHATVATHAGRWSQFATWAREQGVRDLAKVDNTALATAYAEHVQALVQAGSLTVATAQNRISTVNVVFASLRGDRLVALSPRDYAGTRSNVRTMAPASLDPARVQATVTALQNANHVRAAATLGLARAFGVRREEAIKADLDRWSREAIRHGAVNVIDGTKGGRDAPRWVPVGEAQRLALDTARAARPTGSRNLIASHESYTELAVGRLGEINQARAVLHQHGIPGYHDARAAYACQRYYELTGQHAPVITGQSPIDRRLDQQVREKLSQELGHNRTDVLVSYIGGRK
ncbi:integrase domain-containing protein [Modicisalibacter luteus]|uniref:Integrase domain-containing protein n=1 Tax=Modicisalibacter luteus TaxID=453962 RepID=A0ABV7M343_9GAMM|nr:integrase domain-containing protein [Halomonas lutea]GHB15770.1 hypothetical protein GCM10007159_42590 [Halomonas lutea]